MAGGRHASALAERQGRGGGASCACWPAIGPRPASRCATPRAHEFPGFDLTFSAPKSVSILFGVGDSSVSEAVRRAHDAAVRDAIGYVERATSQARRGHGGQHVIAGRGLVAAAFRHRTSRLGDPQLHTHVLVANLVEGADGRWSALDGRLLYAHAKTAGYLYEARLRAELTARLGVEWTPVRNGVADIRGVSPTVMRAFSRRRAEIEAELERRGESVGRGCPGRHPRHPPSQGREHRRDGPCPRVARTRSRPRLGRRRDPSSSEPRGRTQARSGAACWRSRMPWRRRAD